MENVRVAVIGAGFSGIAAAAGLLREGERDFVVLERSDAVGGTWRDNQYPGCACDVPSHLYSLSFAPNPGWSRSFSPQPEILAYLRRVAADLGLQRHLRTGTEVQQVTWQGDHWLLRTSRGELTAQSVIAGIGPFSTPKLPALPGLADFAGTVVHTGTWDPDLDLTGKRVAVIGTGASAIQVVPELQQTAAQVHLFQRTPAWVLPRADRRLTRFEHGLFRRVPGAQKLARGLIYGMREALWMPPFVYQPRLQSIPMAISKAFLKHQVKDPALRAALTPDYVAGCKRVLLSNSYYRSLTRPNVELIASAAEHFGPGAVTSADGRTREVDVVVLATGFHVADNPLAELFVGRDGVRLSDVWSKEGMSAHRGTTFTGFPNLFLLLGPNTNLGHTSVVYMAESQLPYVLGALRTLRLQGAVGIEPSPEAQQRWNATVQRHMRGTVWNTGGCSSWYLDAAGNNPVNWPGSSLAYHRAMRRFDPEEHLLSQA